ncbi:hypothetical protein Patl1_23448 [Pistacia atlantica]|uniref:Uncharacterized protein n=1 Tax=Pistacia atlantica TaxID=434234 RepID=A0ACC0ZXL1_9ROSI|nr:hypothetical protein Patl1_23448 [Pistacia atlantica]
MPSFWNGRSNTNTSNGLVDVEESNDAIDEEELNCLKSNSVKEKLKSSDDVLVTLDDLLVLVEEPQPKIQKVPYILRDTNNFKKYYEPRVISICPYHHENANLKVMESSKLKSNSLKSMV